MVFYVDGPVLDLKYKSFIGMQPIPINYGMTMAEYARMLMGEKMLSQKANEINAYNITTQPTKDTPFHVQFIKCQNYTHKSKYTLPVKPSPNLPNMQAIYLYPSTCLFEGTALSEGRGTDKHSRYLVILIFQKIYTLLLLILMQHLKAQRILEKCVMAGISAVRRKKY
jgi:uncharacterized protein YbbC (DUF1343 family)